MSEFAGMRIGVLELQGDFAEHSAMLGRLGAEVVPIRAVEHVDRLDGVVIPGGESTTIGKLLKDLGIMPRLRALIEQGLPCFGTCAGCILMAKDTPQHEGLPRLATMDITVMRNAFGSQIDSFEADVSANLDEHFKGGKLHAVHIRAPAIKAVGPTVDVLASFHERPVLVRQGYMLACTFHPELTSDFRVHQLFLSIAKQRKSEVAALN